MTFKQLALKVGLSRLEKLAKPGTVDDIDPATAIAANAWAMNFDGIKERPFPDAGRGDLVLSDSFKIPDNSWGRVWFQRQFWLEHKSGVTSRWINGRIEPQEVLVLP